MARPLLWILAMAANSAARRAVRATPLFGLMGMVVLLSPAAPAAAQLPPAMVLPVAPPTIELSVSAQPAQSGTVPADPRVDLFMPASVPQSPVTVSAPPVEHLVERALSRAPSLAARRQRIVAAETAATAADIRPDPMLEFEYRSGAFPRYTIGSDPGSMVGASITQGLLSRGRRSARLAVAHAEVQSGRAELETWAASLATAVRVAYAQLFVLDREASTLSDAAQLLRLLEATASARYAAGVSDQASVLRVQLERTRLGERLADIVNERFAVQATLNRLMDDPASTPVGVVGELPMTTPPTPGAGQPADQSATVVAQAPEIAMRHAEIAAAEQRVEAARQELRRSWTVGGGMYWQGGFDRMATFNVGLELPLWNMSKKRSLVAAAQGDVAAARLDLENMASEIQAEAARLSSAWHTAQDQIERYTSALLPQNSAALDATRSGYLAGRSDFASLLDEFRRWIDVRVGLARREADRYSARVQFDGLLTPATHSPRPTPRPTSK